MRPSQRTWRIRGIPRGVDRERLARALRHHSDLQWPGSDAVEDIRKEGHDVIIHTLAPDLRANFQVATVRFREVPSQLQALRARDELNIKIKISPEDPVAEVLVDEHFDGITTLFSPVTDEEHQIDILAVSGLGSHPFGSFVNKKDGNMWLTNNLPRDMPAARVMIFGYESRLQGSRSQIELDDLAGPVHIAISQISQSRGRPLLLIGHSLGGLLVKEALIRSAESGSENGLPNPLDMIMGIFLFGTPNDGLDIESLVPMVNDQPNRSLLESLRSTGSQMLSRQRRDFSKVLERTTVQLFCLYETELSPTATQDPATREWKMGGPLRSLVSKSSATSCLPAGAPLTSSVSIRRNHSDLVKFSSHDAEYDKVAYILQQVKRNSAGDIIQERELHFSDAIREQQNGNSTTSQHTRVMGDPQVHSLVKRSADDMLPQSVGKRPRLASHSQDEEKSQAGQDTVLRDSGVRGEMEGLKEELIGRLYFSKIDERLTHLAPAQGTTCRWFLTESKYQFWQDVARQAEHGGFLWIKGHPGTGKSTLMKYLFQDAKDKSQNDPSHITLSFFFLARGTPEEKTTTGLYRSLLHQLFEIASDLKQSLGWMTINGARTIEQNGWSEEALKQTLKCAVPKLGKRSLTMFVDALDECDADKADDMVSFFEELCECAAEAAVQLRICFSSRYYPTVVIDKGVEVSLEVENGHAEDIRKYVKSKLKLTSKAKPAETLRSEILEKSSGIFLWVVLVLDILNKKKTSPIQTLRDHLKGIPPGLDDLFRMILARDGDNLEQLKLCLNWILFARRALKPQELYFAVQLASEKECSGFWDETDLDLDHIQTFVRSSSKGLAEVTRSKSSEVQFIHESVRDFLLGEYRNQWSGSSENVRGHGHQILRDCCLAQLNASINQQVEIPDPLPRASQTAELRNAVDLKFPLLQYSVHNILYHSNLAQKYGIEQGQFLSEFSLQQWIPLSNVLEQYEIRRYTQSASLLYILGEKNLGELIRIHSQRKSCFKVEAERYGTPMLAALVNNSQEAVQTFLRAQAEDEPPSSPLHGLCEKQRNHKTRFSRDYLYPRRRETQVLCDLVDKDEEIVACVFVLSTYGLGQPLDPALVRSTLLPLAIERSHEALVRCLVAQLHEVTAWELGTVLLKAVKIGSEAIIKVLLDRGADINSAYSGGTPLVNAIRNGHMAVVKLLLEEGADVNLAGQDYETPLPCAARLDEGVIFKLLLEKGADIESRDTRGRTALSVAAAYARAEYVGLLLEKGAYIESRDYNGSTPLLWAAQDRLRDTSGTVKLLLDAGADVNRRDNDGISPIRWAAANLGYGERITKMLVEGGAYIETRDITGRTPLSWVAANSWVGAVELLLEKGADAGLEDKDGWTPLYWASLSKPSIERSRVITLLQRHLGVQNEWNGLG